ncbi:hypothetical protein MUTS15_07370 [Escherichia coli]|nr:hypothetical protein MUTS15_07370 [Escherichia coli]
MLQIKARTKILALFCAMSFLMYVDRVNLSATAGLIKDELGLSNTELGVIFLLLLIPMQFFKSSVAGSLIDLAHAA